MSSAPQKARLVVMISGSGSNLQAMINAVEQGHLDAEIALVVSNRKDAYGLVRAEQHGIPTLYFPLKPYTDEGVSRGEYDIDLAEKIAAHGPDLIVLAGWMHVLSAAFLDYFAMQVINLHPALPGQFPGVKAIERAYEAYLRGIIDYSGCMVHYVVPEVDAGPVITQAVVPLHTFDTLEAFSQRMHGAEHQIIVQAVALALQARFTAQADTEEF
jgi:formyltetrahydrofolate-dependent phosphoribosylglycinamide formyltransferase